MLEDTYVDSGFSNVDVTAKSEKKIARVIALNALTTSRLITELMSIARI